jgi:competence protein ComEC
MVPLEWLAGLPHAAWEQHAPTSWSVPLALAGALWMLLPRGFPARWAGIAWMLPLFMGIADKPGHGEVWLTVLDVGQGLATVVRTSDHALVFDTGPAFSDQSDAGARIVVPYLRHAGVNRLDGLIVSHDDIDHSGGALSVARAVPVTWFASSLPESHPMHNATPEDRRCESGQSWTWDGVRFETLHPSAGSYNEKNVKDNDRSCVLRVVSSYGAALITADIERPSEYQLLQLPPGSLSADLLVVPHHGSRTSSTPEFVQAVAPRVAILALGHRNRFGHPHPAVVARYRGARAKILRTDVSGALEARMSAAGMEIGTARDRDRRYWQGR